MIPRSVLNDAPKTFLLDCVFKECFCKAFFQETDCDIGADAVASGSGIAKSNNSVDQADGAEAVDLERVQACALDGVLGADAGSNAEVLHKPQ